MSPISNPAIPKGSTVLITGANGFIGSHIADKFLQFGYKVRGTSRNPAKYSWLSSLFDAKYGKGKFELVAVPDMEVDGAYDEVVKGVSAVVHCATNYTLSSNPHEVIPSTLAGTRNALSAAAKEPGVKRFVLTSSSSSALIPTPNVKTTVTVDTWNEWAIKEAYKDPPYEDRSYPVYAASKTLAEKEAWKFVQENKPAFVLNAVLPHINFGKSLDPVNQGHPSTSGWIAELFNGNPGPMAALPPQNFVDVQDNALLHVAAAIHPGVERERIFAFAGPYNGNSLLAAMRALYPGRAFVADFQSDEDRSVIEPRARAEALLRDMGKDAGWTSLLDSIRMNTEDLV